MKEKAIVFTARERAELMEREIDNRPLKPDEVAGSTIVSLISPGTEIGGMYLGDKFPAFPGYCAVFKVEEKGNEVKDIKVGDIVFVSGPSGIGGHHSYQRCGRETVLMIPDDLNPEIAVHARLMGVSMTTLVTTTAVPGDMVFVTGLGIVGNLASQIFTSCGYETFGVDPIEIRRKLAEMKGIRTFEKLPFDDHCFSKKVGLVAECSGHEQAVLDACKIVRKKGEVVLIGVPRSRKTDIYAFDILELVFKRYVVIRSGWEWEISRYPDENRIGSVFGNFATALKWLKDRRVNVDGLFKVMRPEDAQEAYQMLLRKDSDKISVVFKWQ